jgi:predicted RNase H-related nuclease YkuK (DUF458 family)
MQSVLTGKWRKLDGTQFHIPIRDVVEKALIHESELGNKIKVCIGTDSQVHGLETEFATVVLLLRKGKGGYMYISSDRTKQRMTIKERMLHEVSKSIEIAYHLCSLFDEYMRISIPIRALAPTLRSARPWDISCRWALPSRLNPTL